MTPSALPEAPAAWTHLRLLRWTTGYLTGKGIERARLDAEVMLADLLGMERVGLYLNFDRPLQKDELAAFRERVRRRAAREPVAYIVGRREFYGLDLAVDPRVLVPRPETELLVDLALARLKSRSAEAPHGGEGECLVDLGTGSGAIALALAHERLEARVWALDKSMEALEVARANALRLGLEARIAFHQGDLLAPLAGLGKTFDLIAANLPYVPRPAFADMPLDVKAFEPRRALDGGEDGLGLIRPAIHQALPLLSPGGAFILEIWPSQAEAVLTQARDEGYGPAGVHQDLAGHDRAVVLVRGGDSD